MGGTSLIIYRVFIVCANLSRYFDDYRRDVLAVLQRTRALAAIRRAFRVKFFGGATREKAMARLFSV